MAAPKENRYNRKWSDEELVNQFLKAYEYAKKSKDCLCLYDAIAETEMPYSTYFYWSEKNKDLDLIKRDTLFEIVRRVNKGTLHNDFNATAGIWRMKQCGEKDTQYQEQNVKVNNEKLNEEQVNDRIQELLKKLKD